MFKRIGTIGTFMMAASLWGGWPTSHAIGAGVQDADPQVRQLQSDFFTGPITGRADLMPVMPDQMPEASRIGLQTHFNQAKSRPWFDPDQLLPYMQALGVKWIRDGLNWHDLDANFDNVYETPDAHDQWMQVLDQNGFKLLAPMLYGPAGKLSPDALADRYVHYVSFMLDRYPNAIGAIQIWNEPNNFGGWRQRYGGKWYGGPWVDPFAQFLASSAKQLRERYPHVKIISGTGIEATTAQAITPAAQYLDATYIHPYPRRDIPEYMPMKTGNADGAQNMFDKTMLFTEQIDRWMNDIRKTTGNNQLGLWITEYGSSVYRPDEGIQGDHLHHPPVDRKTQAKTIARLMITALESDIQKAFVFILADDYTKPTKPGFGLLTTTYDIKPSFAVFGRINAVTRGTVWPDGNAGADVVSVAKTTGKTAENALVPTIEDVHVVGFKRADGLKMLSFSAPITAASDTSDNYQAIGATLKIDPAMGDAPLLLNLLTGESETLSVKKDSTGHYVQVTVEDYPCLLIANPAQDSMR